MAAFNAAVPPPGLVLQEPAGRLALDRPSWHHLVDWLDRVERLPPDLSLLSADTRGALQDLRTALQEVGSPRAAQLAAQPAAGPQPPEGLYEGVLWVVRRLQSGASAMAARMQRLLQGGTDMSAGAWTEALLQLGTLARDSRGGVGSVAQGVRAVLPEIVRAHGKLVSAFAADADRLRVTHEELGALRAKVTEAERAVGEKGLLATLVRSNVADRELEAVQAQWSRQAAQAEEFRQAIAGVSAVVDEAVWAEPALNAVAEFIEQVQKAWTQVGSGVAQVAADASTSQMEDAGWREAALGLRQASTQWKAVADAAQAFIAAVPAGWAARVLHEEVPT